MTIRICRPFVLSSLIVSLLVGCGAAPETSASSGGTWSPNEASNASNQETTGTTTGHDGVNHRAGAGGQDGSMVLSGAGQNGVGSDSRAGSGDAGTDAGDAGQAGGGGAAAGSAGSSAGDTAGQAGSGGVGDTAGHAGSGGAGDAAGSAGDAADSAGQGGAGAAGQAGAADKGSAAGKGEQGQGEAGTAGAAGGEQAGSGGESGMGQAGEAGAAGGGFAPNNCTHDSQCPPTGSDCFPGHCVEHACHYEYLPAGMLIGDKVPGDCRMMFCGTHGDMLYDFDASDRPDENDCVHYVCTADGPVPTFEVAGTHCSMGTCDGAGACLQQ